MQFLQRTPFARLLLPLILGILIFQYFHIRDVIIYISFVLSLFCILISYFLKSPSKQYQFRWIFGLGIYLFLIVLGYYLSVQKDKEAEFEFLNKKSIFRAEIVQAPIEKQKSIACEIKIIQHFNDSQWENATGRAQVYIQKDSLSGSLRYGDRLMLEAYFKAPMGAENPGGFNYAAYLKRQGITATSYIASGTWLKTGSNPSFSVYRLADFSRSNLLKIYKAFEIAGDEFAVLAALTLGYTDALQPDLRKSYSATGAMHILSVSGLHVGIVYIVFAFMFSFLNTTQKQKVIKAVIITVCLWLYAFLTGLSPSVVRATLMFTFVAIGTALQRKPLIYNTVFMSAFFMLLINPNFLYDIGFQLSFTAVLSIIFFQKPISNLVHTKNKPLLWLRDLVAVSLAAQLGTIPITLYYFHQFPNYFLLTNLVAIPLSSLVIYLAMALLMLNFVPFVSIIIAFLLKWSLWLLNFLIVGIQNIPYSVATIIFDFKQMVLVIICISAISIYFYTKKFVPIVISLLALLTVELISLTSKYHTLNSQKIIVFSSQKHTHINFINQNKNYVITSDTIDLEKVASGFWRIEYIEKAQFLNTNSWFSDGYAFFGSKKILILDKQILQTKTTQNKINVDYLIIGNKLKPKIEQILENIEPSKIIVDNTISAWYTENIQRICDERNIEFYSVAEKGAYTLNFINSN